MWETKGPGRAASSSRNTIAKTLEGKHSWRTGRMARRPVFQAELEQKEVRSRREQANFWS